MEALPLLRPAPFALLQSHPPSRPKFKSPANFGRLLPSPAALKSPRGFGERAKKRKQQQQRKKPRGPNDEDRDEDGDDEPEGEDDVAIPEVVTNRMIRRMGLSVGIPLSVGLLFFPFFYYLKVVAKIDVPSWVPVIVSFVFFGAALAGVSYGIVSASWDPLREGSLLGWNEARQNWPVFWQSIRGGTGKK